MEFNIFDYEQSIMRDIALDEAMDDAWYALSFSPKKRKGNKINKEFSAQSNQFRNALNIIMDLYVVFNSDNVTIDPEVNAMINEIYNKLEEICGDYFLTIYRNEKYTTVEGCNAIINYTGYVHYDNSIPFCDCHFKTNGLKFYTSCSFCGVEVVANYEKIYRQLINIINTHNKLKFDSVFTELFIDFINKAMIYVGKIIYG